MARDVFVNFAVLVTLAVVISAVVIATTSFAGTWIRKLLFGVSGVVCGLIVMQFSIFIAPGVMIDFRNVVPALAGLYGGVPMGIAVALPMVLYRYTLGGSGATAGMTGMIVSAVVAGLMRVGRHTFYQRASGRLVGRSLLISALSHTALLLIPQHGLQLFGTFWLGLVLANGVGLLICIFVLQARLTAQRNLDEVIVLANTDHLTGLPNHRSFQQALRAVDSPDGCLLLLDIDHFKTINDTFGHAVGDQVLQGVAGVIRGQIRMHDVAFRYGGEEFAILLSNCPLHEGIDAAERLRRSVSEWQLKMPDRQSIRVTLSGGIVPLHPNLHPSEQFAAADQLLYHAKQTGRNRIVAWSETDEIELAAR